MIEAVLKMLVLITDIIMKEINTIVMEKRKVIAIQSTMAKTITAILRKATEEIQTRTIIETQTKKDILVGATRAATIIMKNTRKNTMAIATKIIKRTEDTILNKKDHRTITHTEIDTIDTKTRTETGKINIKVLGKRRQLQTKLLKVMITDHLLFTLIRMNEC